MTAGRLLQVAGAVGLRGLGWRRQRPGGLAVILPCRWRGLELVLLARGGLEASDTVAGRGRHRWRFSIA